jgi:hypothetical protein
MNIPIYDITFNSENPDDLFLCNSLVDMPAVEVDFMAFKQQFIENKEKIFTFEKNELEHKIFGCSIRADFPIYRIDNFGREYFVRFSKETIEQLVLKYSKDNNFNLVSLNHDGQLVEGVTLIEWFIKDTEKNINPKGFEHIENGSLFCTYKVENPDVWEKIQNGEIKGFSIEICCDIEPTNETIELSKQEPEKEENINSFIEDLYNYLIGEGIDNSEIEILFADSKKKLIEKALKDKEHIAIKTEGKSKTINGWIYANVDNTLYVWDNKEFHIIHTKNIDTIKITQTTLLPNWDKAEQHPFFPQVRETIEKSDNITDVGSVDNNLIYDSIFNHKIVMLRYNDEQQKNCLDYRQVLICEYGITRKGNTAIRAYEFSGSTHTPDEIPGWRTFLIKRLINIKSTPEGLFKPITQAPPKFNPNPIKDRDNFIVIWKSQF